MAGISAAPTILDVVCRATGMGFAAVARVTDTRWIACGVHDTIDFGLVPGGELKVETTICNEFRQSGQGVVIDHVSIDAGASLLLKAPHDERARGILALVQASVARMSGLIDNLLDFARGRLGGGMNLARRAEPLELVLLQVVDELRFGHPGRVIWTDIALAAAVDCDPGRIAQLLSNLVGNALTHGSVTSMIRVSARAEDGVFVLSVANDGAPIPAATLDHLFQPFERGASGPSSTGAGARPLHRRGDRPRARRRIDGEFRVRGNDLYLSHAGGLKRHSS